MKYNTSCDLTSLPNTAPLATDRPILNYKLWLF